MKAKVLDLLFGLSKFRSLFISSASDSLVQVIASPDDLTIVSEFLKMVSVNSDIRYDSDGVARQLDIYI